jgi:hypothetical protein
VAQAIAFCGLRVFDCLRGEHLMKFSLSALLLFCFTVGVLEAGSYSFQTINNQGDPNFNQLLGINNAGTIGGYFGDGTVVPNNGYTWTKAGGFDAENFPNAVQTQVVAINNLGGTPGGGPAVYNTAGFYVDSAGANHGFIHDVSAVMNPFVTMDNLATNSVPPVNRLLGMNDWGFGVGFYLDSAGNAHAYETNGAHVFEPIVIPNALSVIATGINNNFWISGFFTDASGITVGFLIVNGQLDLLEDPSGNGTNTSFFGLNNNGLVVGSFVDANGNNGFVYNVATRTWQTVNDPNQSFSAAFGVSGTFINGINDQGDLVGFYSDGTHVNGMLATPTPEPASLGLLLLGGIFALRSRALNLSRKRKRPLSPIFSNTRRLPIHS